MGTSKEVLDDANDIVQLAFRSPWLVVSTVSRAIVCDLNGDSGRGTFRQVGLKERKQHSDFGIAILPTCNTRDKPNLITARSDCHLWLTDIDGYVKESIQFSNANSKDLPEIPILNPSRLRSVPLPAEFGRCIPFKRDYVVTYSKQLLFILHIGSSKVVSVIRRLRAIICVAVCGSEIFIVEGDRSVIRISDVAEDRMQHNVSQQGGCAFVPPVEFEAEDDIVASADEAREFPPLENIDHLLAECRLENELNSAEYALVRLSRRMVLFDRINSYKYDDAILYSKKSKKSPPKPTVVTRGMVEIGHDAMPSTTSSSPSTHGAEASGLSIEDAKLQSYLVYTRPSELDESFCERFVCYFFFSCLYLSNLILHII